MAFVPVCPVSQSSPISPNSRSFFYMATQILLKYELQGLNQVVTFDISKLQWKSMYTKAINSFWTKSLVTAIKSKKTLRSLETHNLRVGTMHTTWREIETASQVKRSIVRARIITGTYTLQSNRHTFSKKTVDPTCILCQLEE